MTRYRRNPGAIFTLILVIVTLSTMFALASCTKRTTHLTVIEEAPAPVVVPEFVRSVDGLLFTGQSVWIGPVNLLVPAELLVGATPLDKYGVLLILGQLQIPMFELSYGSYATKHKEVTLWLETTDTYTIVTLDTLVAMDAMDLAGVESTIVIESVEGELRYKKNHIHIGDLKLHRSKQ